MTKYRLTYFNLRARAELVRILFAAAGVEYEDVRVEFSSWPDQKVKKDAPFGQLPFLEIDGVKICQSNTIARYLANKFGFAGKSELDKAKGDMIVDCIEDVTKEVLKFFLEKDPAKKNELKDKLEKEQLPDFYTKFDALLQQNKNGNGYFVGEELTWADIAFSNGEDWLTVLGLTTSINKFPKLKALKEKVDKVPKIADWIKNRPKTDL